MIVYIVIRNYVIEGEWWKFRLNLIDNRMMQPIERLVVLLTGRVSQEAWRTYSVTLSQLTHRMKLIIRVFNLNGQSHSN